MKQFAVVALVTAMGFVAGVFAGIYFESHRPLPPPPVPFGAEFRHPSPARRRWNGRFDRAQLVARIREIQPQLEAFQRRLGEIDAQFSRDFDTVLNPEQKRKHAEEIKRHQVRRPPSSGPLTDGQIWFMLRDESAHTVLWDVVIPLRLDVLTREYRLDEGQREKVRDLLRQRRDRFLALVDSSPPPSVWLSRLAPMVERVAK